MSRDNFLTPVKEALASRAGNRCSFPGCTASTIGPSNEGPKAVSNTGTAAHISAASNGKGSRRYDPNLTKAQRTSIDNGLWCCRDHGTLIDTDEVTYSSAMLRGWRAIAEKKAQLRQAHGDIQFTGWNELVDIGLASETLLLTSKDFSNSSMGDVVTYCCISEIWGKHIGDSVRDFLIEYARNAFEHGGANQVSIEFLPRGIVCEDDGKHFDIHVLAQDSFGNGGGFAYRELLSALKINAVSSRESKTGNNALYLPLVAKTNDLIANNPCAIAVTHHELRTNTVNYSVISNCDRAYLVTPNFLTYSDARLCEIMLQTAISNHRNIVLVVPNVSEAVLRHYRTKFSGIEVISW